MPPGQARPRHPSPVNAPFGFYPKSTPPRRKAQLDRQVPRGIEHHQVDPDQPYAAGHEITRG